MSPEQRIQEAHGLWELAIARVAAMVEAGADRQRLKRASTDERQAFANWQRVSKDCGA